MARGNEKHPSSDPDRGLMPWEVDLYRKGVSEDTTNILAGRERQKTTNSKAADVKAKPLAVTLDKYLADLEKEKEPSAVEKIRRIKMTLMFLGKHFGHVDMHKITVKVFPGDTVGEGGSFGVDIDPIVFDNEKFCEEDMAVLRNHILGHEYTHYADRIQNEGLTEAKAVSISKDKIRDYEHLVKNVLQVTSILVDRDKDAGISLAVELYSEGKYDKLFARFEHMYGRKYPDRVKKNPEVAWRVFQLAFPELTIAEEGQFMEDKAGIEAAFAGSKASAEIPAAIDPEAERRKRKKRPRL